MSSPMDTGIIVVVGAGGGTGLECVRKLVRDGKSVRAVVRNVEKYTGKFQNAEVVQGDVTDENSLKETFAGCKAVIFAATASAYRGPGGPYEVDYLGLQKTIHAAKAVGVQHLVLVSSRFVNPAQRFRPIRVLLNNIKYSLMDYKFMGEECLRQSSLNYTIVRPGRLTGGDGAGYVVASGSQPGTEYIIAAGSEGDVGKAKDIHRADVAAIACAALDAPEAKNKTIEVVSRPCEDGDLNFSERLYEIFKTIPADAN